MTDPRDKRHALDPSPGEPLDRSKPTRLYLEYDDSGRFIECDRASGKLIESGVIERPAKKYPSKKAA